MSHLYIKNKSDYLCFEKYIQTGGNLQNNNQNDYNEFHQNITPDDIAQLCDIENIVSDVVQENSNFMIKKLHKLAGGKSGDIVFSGIIKKNGYEKEVVIKICYYRKPTMHRYFSRDLDIYNAKKNNNEIAIAHYISNYFLMNPNLTDNFTLFYASVGCKDFFDKNKIFQQQNSFKYDMLLSPSTKNVGILVVEKAICDIKHFVQNFRQTSFFGEKMVSIIIQITNALIIFNKHLGGFFHGDFHTGNVLISNESKERKKIFIKFCDGTTNKLYIKTYGICPKIWDFSATHIGNLFHNRNENSNYFNYLHPNGDMTETYAIPPKWCKKSKKCPIWAWSTVSQNFAHFIINLRGIFMKMGESCQDIDPDLMPSYDYAILSTLSSDVLEKRAFRFVKQDDKYTNFIKELMLHIPRTVEDTLKLAINILNNDEKYGTYGNTDYDFICDLC